MVTIKFASLVLCLLFVLHALRNSSAHAHQGMMIDGARPTATTKIFASAQKEFLDTIPAAAARKMGIGGRKMAVDKETSKISGKDTDASSTSLKRPQYRSIDQNNSNMLEPKTSKSASLGIPGNEPAHFRNTKTHYSQVSTKAGHGSSSKKQVSREPIDAIAHKDEAQRLLKATHEIVTLMHKDYKGMDKPGRKPPINNDEPID